MKDSEAIAHLTIVEGHLEAALSEADKATESCVAALVCEALDAVTRRIAKLSTP